MLFNFSAYTPEQWVLLFFIYGFFGYIWEIIYVSVRQKKLVDRGFLYGPLLPIYGFGALIVLFATIPVKSSPILVFFCGMLAATILEYATGWAMDKLFSVRYWDYTDDFLNLHGYICARASLAWGAFSVFLIYFLHGFMEKLMFLVPQIIATPLALVLTSIFSVDVTLSVRAAFDLKETLLAMAKSNEELRRLQKRLDVVAAFVEEDKARLKERLDSELDNLGEKVEDFKEERAYIRKQKRTLHSQLLQEKRDEHRAHLEQLHDMLKVCENYFVTERPQFLAKTAADMSKDEQCESLSELKEIRQKLDELRVNRALARQARAYRHAQSILKRNHSARSRLFGDLLDELREQKL